MISVADVAANDVDGDGDLDIISASHNKIAWYENDGSGMFAPQRVIESGDDVRPSGVFAADMDGDQDVDVVAAFRERIGGILNPLDRVSIVWYENIDGTAQFGSRQPVYNAVLATRGHIAIEGGDFDGDGAMDIVAVNSLKSPRRRAGDHRQGGRRCWYEAVQYCRVISSRLGIPETQQCYPDPKDLEKDADGNPIDWPINLDGGGLRLLTQA